MFMPNDNAAAQMRMAQYLRSKGVSDQEIQQILGGDPSELAGAKDFYEMSTIPASAAVKNDAKNAFGALGNLLAGVQAGRERNKYEEAQKQFKLGNITRRKKAFELAYPDPSEATEGEQPERVGLSDEEIAEMSGPEEVGFSEEQLEEMRRRGF